MSSEGNKVDVIEDFFGVYLLYCLNPKYKGRTYIGYTRDPNRRIKQHNRGTWAGGAYRTSNRGPWKMVLIVHGFPNNISALRFEWAWQNPTKTIRLQHLNLKKIQRKETEFQFKLRIMSEMLQVGPWCRLPLVIRWLESEFYEDFNADQNPPSHMTICHGPIKSRNLKKTQMSTTAMESCTECLLCSKQILRSNSKLTCLNSQCELECHLTCLSKLFLEPGEYVPIEGDCPFCNMKLKWGDLVRRMKGCRDNGVVDVDSQDVNADVDDNDDQSSEGDDEIRTQDKCFVDSNLCWLDGGEEIL